VFLNRFFLQTLGVFALMLAAMALAMSAAAQTPADLQEEIAALEEIDPATEEEQQQVQTILEDARNEIESALELAARVDSYVDLRDNRPEIVTELNANLQEVQARSAVPDLPETSQALQDRLNLLQSERGVLAEAREQMLERRTVLAGRVSEIAEELATARRALSELVETPSVADSTEQSLVERAQHLLLRARIIGRRTEIRERQRELQTIPDRQLITSARIALSNEEIDALDREIVLIQQRLSDVRMDQADAALEQALQDQALVAEIDAAQALAEQNIELATMLKTMADEGLTIEQSIKLSNQQTLQIRQQADTVNRILATGRVTNEAATLLRQLRNKLPYAQTLRALVNEAVENRTAVQLDLILWQDELRSLDNSAPAVLFQSPSDAAGPGEAANPQRPPIETFPDLLQHRETLLSNLITSGREQLDRLTDKEIAVRETLTETQNLRTTLDRRLLWLPSNVPALSGWPGRVMDSVSWISSADATEDLVQDFRTAVTRHMLAAGICLVLAIAIFLGRRRLQGWLDELNDAVGKTVRDKYFNTPAALMICFVLALPLPLLLSALALPVLLEAELNSLLSALSVGFCGVALTSLVVLMINGLSQDKGVLATHFNWNDRALRALRRVPTWLIWVSAIMVFVFTAAQASLRPDVQHGLGMPAFCLLSASIAAIGYGVFRFERGVAEEVISEGLNDSILYLGLIGFVIAPLIIGALPLLGYYDTAVVLQGRVLQSALLLMGLALLFGVIRRLFVIAQRRLALRTALERRARLAAEREEREKSGDAEHDDEDAISLSVDDQDLEAERQRISNQTRRLLLYLIGAGAIAGFFAIWAAVLPALGIANDITLWKGTGIVDGVRTERPVTVWSIILFFGFIIAGIIAAYNIRGALEIGPFQRLNLSAGSRYAIHTIIGYFLVGAGIVAGFLQLGVDWSRLQWIIAALGVGLGFGLQEIVANFISGLIILFERPVRVGDTVTIGELEGTVTNVAIRATTVKDFDNREVLLPNKAIITENVTNWTLRDSIMRIIVPIGVAYGSDVVAVRDLLLKIAQEEDDVLDTPEPKVFFMNHGDSSLDFEIRVFISNPRKRFRVRHEINLAINIALTEAGIEIPFPQRDLHIKSS
jgi:potassium efflux system protein